MTIQFRWAKMEIFSAGALYETPKWRTRQLGGAILMAAIADYRSSDELAHQDAAQFLYPQTRACKAHYDWVVAMTDGVDAAWLRDALDRSRFKWDAQREAGRPLRRKVS
jgi:hypothetical protein